MKGIAIAGQTAGEAAWSILMSGFRSRSQWPSAICWTLPWALPIRLVLAVGVLAFTLWLLFPWKA